MKVMIRWKRIGESSSLWKASRCLYAYLTPNGRRILYIGKADRATVRQRYFARDKKKIRKRMPISFGLMIGAPSVEDCLRFSWQLLHDIESLLINRIKPPLNTMNKCSRISRPGMKVICQGSWPYSRRRFVDGN